MKICRVLGPVVATAKHPTYYGQKLLIVVPLDESGSAIGDSFLAVDLVQSGPDDRVLVMEEGNGVRQLFGIKQLPIRSVIVGHIDHIDVPEG